MENWLTLEVEDLNFKSLVFLWSCWGEFFFFFLNNIFPVLSVWFGLVWSFWVYFFPKNSFVCQRENVACEFDLRTCFLIFS